MYIRGDGRTSLEKIRVRASGGGMKNLIVGTAGHIDHGKTELIKALTGRDTDRLKEEKERGISIDLGFAEYRISDNFLLGVVDVPGHESFIRNMLAGASGIDLVLFVIAADEGIMPQTVEHLEILELLRTQRGVVAITKSDLVDEEWLELVEEEVREQIGGTFLESSPVIKVSSKTGKGLDEIKEALTSTASELGEKLRDDFLRMPIDRTFTLRGVGTVVTGTIWSGTVRKDETVRFLPSGIESRVKSLEVHDRKVEESTAGCRTALAMTGVAKEKILRGETIVSDPVWEATRIIDVHLECLKSEVRGIENRRRVRFHLATQEVMGRVVLLDRDLLEADEGSFAQIRLEKPVVVRKGDRFVVRSYSPIKTIGGGSILRPFSSRRTKIDTALKNTFEVLRSDVIEDEMIAITELLGLAGVDSSLLPLLTGDSPVRVEEVTQLLQSEGKVNVINDMVFHSAAVGEAKSKVTDYLEKQHLKNPLKTGFPLEEMRNRLFPSSPECLIEYVLEDLSRSGAIEMKGGLIRLSSHEISLGKAEMKIHDELLRWYNEGGLAPPTVSQIKTGMGIDESTLMEIITILKDKGDLIPVSRELLFSTMTVEAAQEKVRSFLLDRGKASASEMRTMLGGSRKFIIPLLEYFDRKGLTRREGDYRVLR
jgi:selenocysteine-specific elongation factor